MNKEARFAAGERAVAEEAHRQHRRLGAQFPEDEEDKDHGAPDNRHDDLRRGPADVVAADEPPHDPEEADARKREADQVEPAVRAVGLL